MLGFRKQLAKILTVTTLLSAMALPTFAEDTIVTSVSGYDSEDGTAQLELSTQPGESSDFVTSFPTIEMTQKLTRVRPSAELANQQRREYISIPLYYQNDYPDVLYGEAGGTVETNGCSITSLAMVATYLTGYEYKPDELAYYFGGRAENNIQRLEKGAEALGLTYEKPENWHYTLAELKKGKCAIVLVDGASKFTSTQHFLVITGVEVTETFNDAGEKTGETVKVFVHDPYAPNYEVWDLVQGFEYGFSESDIIAGYQGAWVFDKASVPEDIQRYYEAAPEQSDPRYPDISLTIAERQLLARVVWVEARGESEEGQQAVAEVVLNRMASDNFADDLRSVIYGEGQFRSVKFLDDAQPGQAQYTAIERAIYGPYVLPEDVVYFATFETNENVWGTIGGHIFCYEYDKDMSELAVEATTEPASEDPEDVS